jgi:drug/metabolite transporter (DMT)-like permease
MTGDRPFLGILFMLGFCVLAPLGDSVAKLLGGSVALGVLLLARFGFQALLLLPVVLSSPARPVLTRRLIVIMSLRTVLHMLGIGAMFAALRYLPLADALAIAFVMPFLMLLLGWLVLGEEVGPHRLAACAVGFVGTLLVIQPNFAEVGAPALLPLVVAVVFAVFMLVTRLIAKQIDPVTLQCLNGFQASLVLVPAFFLWPAFGSETLCHAPPSTLLLLTAMGITGTAAHLMMTWSLRLAPSATLAPMQYLEIPFGTLLGWLIFNDLPDGLAALGILITISAGLYIILRERRLERLPPSPPHAPPAAE